MTAYSGPDPNWVMVGTTQPDGTVVILASTDLSQAELRHETEWLWDDLGPRRLHRLAFSWCELTVRMGTYVMASGSTYEEALRRLFEHWSPATAKPRELSGRRDLGNGVGVACTP